MKKIFFILLLIIGVINTGSNCNSDTDAPFIPDITGSWVNKNDATDKYNFTILNQGTNTGPINGFNNANGDINDFTGSYNNRSIEFTFDQGTTKQGQRYYGTIKGNSETIELTRSIGGTITLLHQ